MNKYTIEAVKKGDYIKLTATIPDEVIRICEKLRNDGYSSIVIAMPELIEKLQERMDELLK